LSQTTHFEQFFKWCREREDIENENAPTVHLIPEQALDNVFKTMKAAGIPISDEEAKTIATKMLADEQNTNSDKQLEAVRTAIYSFIPQLSKLRVRRSPELRMSVVKEGLTLSVEQLSQGEKVLMALIGDIARRLAILNPALDNPLNGDGIVLIDEADLHLHPQWQRSFITRLIETFPNCQFVLTTHSPLMISDAKDVLCHLLDDGKLVEMEDLYGLDANQVLTQVMDTDIRNAQVKDKLTGIYELIESESYEEAKQHIEQLEKELSSDIPELVSARLDIELAGSDDE
jgi:predicted ATP-binding protein involved in virulence